jgi:methionine--tRNA ligase beta chain
LLNATINNYICWFKVWNHPDADKLFCEEINVGEENPRQIASGLRAHYSLEDMQDRKVLVVCNLKSSKIVGFVSEGMVLAAKVRCHCTN